MQYSSYIKQSSPYENDSHSIIRRGNIVRVIWTSAVSLALCDGWQKIGERLFVEDAIAAAQQYADILSLAYL